MTTPGISSKLQDKFIGPYRVLQKIDDLHYLLQPTKGKKRDPIRIHVDRIKRVGEVLEPEEVSLGPDPNPMVPAPTSLEPAKPDSTSAPQPKRRGRPPKQNQPPPIVDEPITVPEPLKITTRSGRHVKPTKHYGVCN